jgi:hypothetical protein
MTKFHITCLLFFLFCRSISAAARNQQDTTATINRDSTTVVAQQSDMGDDASYDSLYLPVPDSLFSSAEKNREVTEKKVNQYKNNPEFAYANDSTYWRKESPEQPSLLLRILFSRALRWVILSFIAGLILFAIYQLAAENNFTMLFKVRRQTIDYSGQNQPGEKINFDELILLSQSEGNFRAAIRFLYLRLIHRLQEISGISINESSTNVEIAKALGAHPEAANFRWLATAYEYVYYGEFVPDQETYLIIRKRFETLQKVFSN